MMCCTALFLSPCEFGQGDKGRGMVRVKMHCVDSVIMIDFWKGSTDNRSVA